MSDDPHNSVTWLIRAIARALSKNSGAGSTNTLERLAEQNIAPAAMREPVPRRLPACAYLPQAVAASILVADSVAAALADTEPLLHWKQNPNYSDALLGEGYMDSYAYAELIGPDGFFAGGDFLMGLLLLGPQRFYKDHAHPAPELYWTLTGPSLWRQAPGDFAQREAGSTIWHAPNVVHATKSLEDPVLAVWFWTQDTAAPAQLIAT